MHSSSFRQNIPFWEETLHFMTEGLGMMIQPWEGKVLLNAVPLSFLEQGGVIFMRHPMKTILQILF